VHEDAAAAEENFPEVQLEHVTEPGRPANMPAEQFSQPVEPVDTAYMPSAQSLQLWGSPLFD